MCTLIETGKTQITTGLNEMEIKGRDRRKGEIFKMVTTLLYKACFDVTKIIVSYRIFQKPLGLHVYNN